MKYFLLNKEEVRSNIWNNPILIKLKCWSKIKKYKTLQKKLNSLFKQIETDIKGCNSVERSSPEIINTLLSGDITEVTSKDYNALRGLSLYDDIVQRIKMCNKSDVLKGKLYGNEIKLEK